MQVELRPVGLDQIAERVLVPGPGQLEEIGGHGSHPRISTGRASFIPTPTAQFRAVAVSTQMKNGTRTGRTSRCC